MARGGGVPFSGSALLISPSISWSSRCNSSCMLGGRGCIHYTSHAIVASVIDSLSPECWSCTLGVTSMSS